MSLKSRSGRARNTLLNVCGCVYDVIEQCLEDNKESIKNLHLLRALYSCPFRALSPSPTPLPFRGWWRSSTGYVMDHQGRCPLPHTLHPIVALQRSEKTEGTLIQQK